MSVIAYTAVHYKFDNKTSLDEVFMLFTAQLACMQKISGGGSRASFYPPLNPPLSDSQSGSQSVSRKFSQIE